MLSDIHNYTHGYVVVPVALACHHAGLFELLNCEERVAFERLTRELHANAGHLRTAMLMLESMGWVARRPGDCYVRTAAAERAASIPEQAEDLMSISMARYLRGEEEVASLTPWIAQSRSRWGIDDPDLAQMVDGMILTPLFSAIARNADVTDANGLAEVWSILQQHNVRVPDWVREELAGLFFHHGWLVEHTTTARFTVEGSFVFARTFLFAIAGSYWPMLQRLDDVIFGDCAAVFARDSEGRERHVDRALNVAGSGRQHGKYFRAMEEIIIEVFNAQPLDTQPRYVADTGCGDGTLLRLVYDAIRHRTLRGKNLDRFPLQLIGIDLNDEALQAAANTLQGIDHRTVRGDIADPAKLIEDLKLAGISDTGNILHIRSFLDHDRPFVTPRVAGPPSLHAERFAFDYAFVDSGGGGIPAGDVYQNLVEHLGRWAEALGRHPLIILEVHCLEPAAIRQYRSQCESLHFDAYQRFSQQLLMQANHFLLAAAEAGLFARNRVLKYPRTLGFTRITLTSFEKRAYRIRWARAEDLSRLLELEAECWESPLRTPGEVLQTRIDRYSEGQFVIEMNGRIAGVIYSQRIADASALPGSTTDSVDRLHTNDGAVVQLLGISIAPDSQHSKLGDQLLEFALQYHELSNNVTEVVGVTRCKEYVKSAHLPIHEYIRLKSDQDLSIDPVLRFHQMHGAVIDRPIPGYRVRDVESQGYGILIRYDVNGRRRVRQIARTEDRPQAAARVSAASIEHRLRNVVSLILDRDEALVSMQSPLMELGLDSFGLMELTIQIERQFQLKLESTCFFQHNSLAKVGALIASRLEPELPASLSPAVPEVSLAVDSEAIAIVGIACRLPGGIRTPQQLWEILISNQSLVGSMSDIRWRWSSPTDSNAGEEMPQYVAYVRGVEQFDASFFNISPAEAELMDPQQRILLELAWECVEEAGHDVRTLAGSDVGVFLGVSGSDYKTLLDRRHDAIDPHYAVATATSAIPNRISYYLDLRGPSVQVDTACSSSLVALHQAVESLKRAECSAALAGGINIICHPNNTVSYRQAGMLAPDGKCKTFDAEANGYVRGEGAVVFLLKRLKTAIADGDHCYATIIGSAVNHGGRAAGFTAPNPEQQADVIRKAMRVAGIAPDRIGYVEAHGTGTSLGDPVEISGLAAAFAQSTTKCVIGAIKTNLGHLEAAAGAAGLLKALLCLNHREIPGNLHFRELNPKISLAGTPFEIVSENVAWEASADGHPRIAGVSSFGSGGTNAHLLVQEYSGSPASKPRGNSPHLILLSAKSPESLAQREADLLAWLSGHRESNLRDVSYTLAVGRAHFEHRSAYVVSGIEELQDALSHVSKRQSAGSHGFQNLRESTVTKRLAGLLMEESLAIAGDAGSLKALGDLYLLGCDLEWKQLFRDAKIQRISMPTYPFARDAHWLPGAESTTSEWLCFGEEWKLAPIDAEFDWQQRLGRDSGQQFCIVYDDLKEREEFCALLEKLLASGSHTNGQAGRIRTVHCSVLSDAAAEWLHPIPDTVFCLASALPHDSLSFDNARTVTSVAFHLSKSLMLRAGDEQIRVVYGFDESRDASRVVNEALAGFVRSAMMENGHHKWKLVAVGGSRAERHQAMLREWLSDMDEVEVLHAGGSRYVRRLTEKRPSLEESVAGFRKGATYLIAGGLGPIGERLCHELAGRFRASLVIFSRSALDAQTQQKLAELRSLGAAVHYFPVDITDRGAVEDGLDRARKKAGQINGVIHLARVVENGSIANKSWESFQRTVRAKVLGTLVLDELTSREPLDFFLMFSSVASLGLRGAADYAYANAFQNAFARHRARLVKVGERSGRTVAQCWGPWSVDTYLDARRDQSWRTAGWDSIEMSDAFEWIGPSDQQGEPVLYLMKALDPEKLRKRFGVAGPASRTESAWPPPWDVLDQRLRNFEKLRSQGQSPAVTDVVEVLAEYEVEAMPRALLDRADHLLFDGNGKVANPSLKPAEVERVLRVSIAEILKTRADFAPERTLQEMGLDSISAMQLATRIEKELGIPAQAKWFIEFATVPLLVEHLAALKIS